MKKHIILVLIILLHSCVSVEKYNQRLETKIAPEKLKHDVDFAYEKLQKLHPDLNWYISKKDLDYKFDSLKTTISEPLNPKEFYQKMAPVIAQVREGHLRLVAPEKRLTKKEIKKLKEQKGLFGRYNFVIDNDRIFVKDNSEKVPNMSVGTEILKINGEPVKEILNRYKPYITSDGFNTTFHKYSMARRWAIYFTIEKGILDSVEIETKYHDSTKTFYLNREKITPKEKKIQKKEVKKKQEERKNDDYNPVTKSYNRNLSFIEKDSSIAVIKIKSFSGFRSKKFYKNSFKTLKKAKTKNLIIDVRDNLGGSLSEITNLYSYLGSEKFPFIKDIEVTSRGSILKANYINTMPNLIKPIGVITYPLYAAGVLFSVKKKEEKFFLKNNTFTKQKSKDNAFLGKVYFLINGSSFSASSIITSKMKGDKHAILVGEETGGANDGTVAGRYSTETLPNSKLKLPIGLMLIKPNIEFTNTKKGVTPNIELTPNLEEILQKKDVELDWVLKDINENKHSTLQ